MNFLRNENLFARLRVFCLGSRRALFFLLGAGLSVAAPAQNSTLSIPIPSAIQRSVKVGHLATTQPLHIAVGIPPAQPIALQKFADSVSNPKSAAYRHFISPSQVGQLYGQSSATVQNIVAYLKAKGMTVTFVAPSHLSVLADCTSGQAEAAFHTTINNYHATNPAEPGRIDYYAYSKALQVPSNIARYVLSVSGLENHTIPKARALTPQQTHVIYDTAPIYNNGMQGQGRTVGISSFDGFQLSNIPLFYNQYGLPAPAGGVGSNVTVITIDGGSESSPPGGEGDLDQQMVLGQAPLCNLRVYDGGGGLIDVLTQEESDNLCDVITESYGWALDDPTALEAHNIHLAMSAQGITYMVASGDDGTITLSEESYTYPDYDPEVLQVGGTVATVDAQGNRISEVGWSGSAGGWVPNDATFNVLPSWQVGNGVPTNINKRLVPDVALNAAGTTDGAYWFFYQGLLNDEYDGTSFASPVFAGSLADSEQQLLSTGALQGQGRFGRIQDLIYSQNGRSDVWYDITQGSNGTLPNGETSNAGPGWDFVTGWGAIDFNAFCLSQVPPVSVAPTAVSIYDDQGSNAVGGVSQLLANDGAYFTEASVPNVAGTVAATQIQFQGSNLASNMTSFQVSLVGFASRNVTLFTYLLNVNSGQYDLQQIFPLTTTDATLTPLTITGANIANYVDSTGLVTLVIRAVNPPRFNAPFSLHIDQAQLSELLISTSPAG